MGSWNTPILDMVLPCDCWGGGAIVLLPPAMLERLEVQPDVAWVIVVVTADEIPVVLVTAVTSGATLLLADLVVVLLEVAVAVVTVMMAPDAVVMLTPLAMLLCHTLLEMVSVFVLTTRFFNLGIICSSSLSGSLISAVMRLCAWRVASAEPLMVMVLSPEFLGLSMSIFAPEISRMALMLQPLRPITRLMMFEGTITFLDFRITSFQPSSFLGPRFGLGAPGDFKAPAFPGDKIGTPKVSLLERKQTNVL